MSSEPAPASHPPRENHPGLPLGRVLAFIIAWLGGSWLIVTAWFVSRIPHGWAIVVLGLLLAAVPVWTLLRGVRGATYPRATTRILVLRPFWYAMLLLPLLAATSVIGGLVGLPFGSAGTTARAALATAAALLLVLTVAGFLGSRRLVVRQLEVRIPRLPTAFDGFKLVQISDLHVGPHTPPRFLRRVASLVQNAQPDLIAVTGDQVDDFARDVEDFNRAFESLQAPSGVYAIPGNHDVYAGWSAVRQGLAAAGFGVLENRAIPLERQGERLWIAGTGDPAAKNWPRGGGVAPDISETLAEIPSNEPVVALAHNPALWPSLAEHGVDLTLSGHTHYGQLAIPGRNWCMASPFLKLAMGWHRKGHSLLYIHPGSNYWGIPFRLGTPPEVTALTLRRTTDGEAGISPPHLFC